MDRELAGDGGSVPVEAPPQRHHPRIVACYLHPISRHGYPPPAEGSHRYLEELNALGFQSIELEGIHEPHLHAVHGMREELRGSIMRLGVRVPFYCVVLPGLASADAATRSRNLELFQMGCETAVALGAAAVLDNGPLPPYAFPDHLPVVRHYDDDVIAKAGVPASLDWKAYWAGLVQTYRGACDVAADHGLDYVMHPAIGVLCANTDGFLLFRDAVDRPNLKFCLDTANQFLQRDHLPTALIRLADHLAYVHLSDNRGTRQEHLPMGEGSIDWAGFFATLDAIGYDGHLGIDIGGGESGVRDLDRAYAEGASFVASFLANAGAS